ncbi:MAG: amino acid ABC transporter permease [Oscillospiraceae bacterium]
MEKNLFEWIVFLLEKYWKYFLDGTIITLVITLIGTIIGYILGFAIGILKSTPITERDPAPKRALFTGLKWICNAFIEIFRDTPMMVQAMVIYYGLKQNGVDISPFVAAVLVTFLNTGAYMAETVRGGIMSIDNGQREGAIALGMSHFQTMFCVVLPQVFRNIIPEMGNQFITNIKMTSVLNVIGIAELYFATKTAANTYYRYYEAFLITGIIYFVLCFVFSRLLALLEKKLNAAPSYELAKEYM